MKRSALLALAVALSGVAIAPTVAQEASKNVLVRFAADFSPPPHPAGLAMKHFADRLPQVIPGSEARLSYAGALYTIPEAFEAMRSGNLEMTWMQMGKAAQVEPWLMAVVGPGILTTPGAVDQIEKTETYKMLVDRLQKNQAIKVFGAGHMSFGIGVGGKNRFVKAEDFVGRKVRSMGPAENPVLESWKANPVVLSFGEVRNALESGVIDGLMTSIGGWLSVREQAPFYTIGGAGVMTGDYYMVSASRSWWDRLSKPTQDALSKLIAETIHLQKELNWCVDKMTYEQYGTLDPSKPGAYWMTAQEVSALTRALGQGPTNWVKSKTPQAAHRWVDQFREEGKKLSAANPVGSSWIEKVKCWKYASKEVRERHEREEEARTREIEEHAREGRRQAQAEQEERNRQWTDVATQIVAGAAAMKRQQDEQNARREAERRRIEAENARYREQRAEEDRRWLEQNQRQQQAALESQRAEQEYERQRRQQAYGQQQAAEQQRQRAEEARRQQEAQRQAQEEARRRQELAEASIPRVQSFWRNNVYYLRNDGSRRVQCQVSGMVSLSGIGTQPGLQPFQKAVTIWPNSEEAPFNGPVGNPRFFDCQTR